ncbi:subclass B3 metallo-beta-lactamase [Phyllobacterium sp. 22552]|uniref:subclass B3 metallo-beta-lactamase n=1 Tax=Phyllobacterium sp. 22552 TaxID=3453941 RepID=UPI003F851C1E
MRKLLITSAIISTVLASSGSMAQDNPEWSQPTEPFHVVGNIYYVGTKGIGAYLITSNEGAILLDGALDKTAQMVERNIIKLGFALTDVKIIIVSHAHFDHAGGVARIKRDTGAKLVVSKPDRWAMEHGLHDGETSYPRGKFPAVKVDQVVDDGDEVKIGNVGISATLTPGHTPGCTTWSTAVREGTRALNVVFPCSLSVAGNILVGNDRYPHIVDDFQRSLDLMQNLKADIVLPSHPEIADVMGKKRRVESGEARAFEDPDLLAEIVRKSRVAFGEELQRQREPE